MAAAPLGSLGGLGAEVALGAGAGRALREAGDGSGAQLWDPVPGHGLLGRGPRTHVREDTCEAGSCTHAGWQGRRENTPFPAAQLEETQAIPAGAA